MGLLDALGGLLQSKQPQATGVDIDPNAFKIPDADKYRNQAQTQYGAAVQRQNYIQPKQQNFLESLEQQAAGQGPSLSAEMLKSAQNRNLAQQVATAQASRINPALAQREMFKNQMQSGGQIAGQAAQGRIQEQLNAQNLLGNQVNNMSNQADQLTQQYLSQGFNIAQAQQQAQADMQHLQVQQALGLAGVNAEINKNNANSNLLGSGLLMNAGAGILGRIFPGGGGSGSVTPQSDTGYLGVNTSFSSPFTSQTPSTSSSTSSFGIPKFAKGGRVPKYADGGRIPGMPMYSANTEKNDVFHAQLTPGEIVVPHTEAQTPKKAKAFLDALFEKESKRK